MKIFGETVRTIILKPFIVFYMAFLLLLIYVVHTLNPVIPLVTGLIDVSGADIFETILSMTQFFLSSKVLPYFGIAILVFSVLLALAAGILLPGYLNILYNSVNGYRNSIGTFTEGYRKYFLKITFLFFKAGLISILLTVFILVAAVPMMVVLRAANIEKPELVLVSIFVVFLTVTTIFFCSMFLRIYLVFWLTAAVNGEKPFFLTGKRVADRNFWPLVRKFLLFDMFFIGFHTALSYTSISGNIYGFAAAWGFNTVFFALFFT